MKFTFLVTKLLTCVLFPLLQAAEQYWDVESSAYFSPPDAYFEPRTYLGALASYL